MRTTFRILCASMLLCAGAAFAADVGVSVEISQPGVYGRVDIGRFPQPQVIVPQPVLVGRPVVVAQPVQPVYMWVPPGHRKNWRPRRVATGSVKPRSTTTVCRPLVSAHTK